MKYIISGLILSLVWLIAALESDKAQGYFWASVLCLTGFLFGLLAEVCHVWWIWIIAGMDWAAMVLLLLAMWACKK